MTDTMTMIAERRRALADRLDALTPAQWDSPSLCAGWRVRDVLGHLTTPFAVSVPRLLLVAIRARGFDGAMDRLARERGARPPTELVAELRANAEHRFRPPGLPHEAPLTDVVVHGLDMTVPLGLEPELPGDVARRVLGFVTTPKAARTFGPGRVLDTLRVEVTDADWSWGDTSAAVLRGPAWAVLLALTGRGAGLDACEGPGVAALRNGAAR